MSAPRARVEQVGGVLRIVVPTRVRRTGITFQVLFLAFWVVFWTKLIVDASAAGETSEIIVGAVLITAVAALLLPSVLWVLVGREELLVTSIEVAVRRAIGPVGRTRRFAATEIDAIRAVDPHVPTRLELAGDHPVAQPGLYGAIELVVDGKEHLVAEVDPDEARDLVRRICDALGRPVTSPR